MPTVPVMLAGFAAFVDLYATQPLLPFLARTFRASSFEVSLTITAPTIAVALAAPAIGRLADTVGLRRIIVWSAFAVAIATGLAATSATLRQLIVWRFVQGLVTPGIFAGTVAYIHEVWPASHGGRGMAAYMTGTIAGGFTGRAVAGLVAADASWQASFVALGLINLAVAMTLWWFLPPESDAATARTHEASRAQRSVRTPARSWQIQSLLGNRQLQATFAIGFCILFTQVAMFTYVTFHLAAPPFSMSSAALGWLFAVYLVGLVVTPFGGRWIDRYGHRTGLALAMGLGAAGALLTLMPSLVVIAAGLALCSTGVFVAQAATSSYIGAVTTRDRALAVGLYSTCYYAGGSVGGAAPSALWMRGGWPACVGLIVVVQCVGVAIALTQWTAAATPIGAALPEQG